MEAEGLKKRVRANAGKLKNYPRRRIRAFEVSYDGETRHLRALCDVCFEDLPFDAMVKGKGNAGARQCDHCGCVNENE